MYSSRSGWYFRFSYFFLPLTVSPVWKPGQKAKGTFVHIVLYRDAYGWSQNLVCLLSDLFIHFSKGDMYTVFYKHFQIFGRMFLMRYNVRVAGLTFVEMFLYIHLFGRLSIIPAYQFWASHRKSMKRKHEVQSHCVPPSLWWSISYSSCIIYYPYCHRALF